MTFVLFHSSSTSTSSYVVSQVTSRLSHELKTKKSESVFLYDFCFNQFSLNEHVRKHYTIMFTVNRCLLGLNHHHHHNLQLCCNKCPIFQKNISLCVPKNIRPSSFGYMIIGSVKQDAPVLKGWILTLWVLLLFKKVFTVNTSKVM